MAGTKPAVHVRRGDTVEVTHGKYRGKRERVSKISGETLGKS